LPVSVSPRQAGGSPRLSPNTAAARAAGAAQPAEGAAGDRSVDNLLDVAYRNCLVGGLEHVLFSIIYGIIIPTDFYIFQRD